jgi:hypothetical protein
MAKFMFVKFSLMAEITDADALREAALKKFDANDSTSDDYPDTADWHASEGRTPGRTRAGVQIKMAHSASSPALHGAVFLAARLSRSRPPRLGRSRRSRRMRSAAPALDRESAHLGLAPIEDGGVEQEPGPLPGRRDWLPPKLGGSVRHAIVLVKHVTCGRRAWGTRSGWLPRSQRGRPA